MEEEKEGGYEDVSEETEKFVSVSEIKEKFIGVDEDGGYDVSEEKRRYGGRKTFHHISLFFLSYGMCVWPRKRI